MSDITQTPLSELEGMVRLLMEHHPYGKQLEEYLQASKVQTDVFSLCHSSGSLNVNNPASLTVNFACKQKNDKYSELQQLKKQLEERLDLKKSPNDPVKK